jgi:hypothetical protein
MDRGSRQNRMSRFGVPSGMVVVKCFGILIEAYRGRDGIAVIARHRRHRASSGICRGKL